MMDANRQRELQMTRSKGYSVLAVLFTALIAAALPGLPAIAAGGSTNDISAPAAPVDPNITQGRKELDAKNWSAAAESFQKAAEKDSKNADAFNWLGFAQRNMGNYDAAFESYGKALAINARHRGAHEYIGEAYLKQGNLAKAEEHLKRLDSICTFGCAEYTELKKKIAAFKASKPS